MCVLWHRGGVGWLERGGGWRESSPVVDYLVLLEHFTVSQIKSIMCLSGYKYLAFLEPELQSPGLISVGQPNTLLLPGKPDTR